MKPLFFKSPAEFRAWLEKNYGKAKECWVGFHKRHTEKPSLTWPESVDQALCFGWIDGIRKSLGEDSYVIRFTPRKPDSIWSAVNVRKVKELTRLGLMRPAGLEAFHKNKKVKTAIYSYEQRKTAKLSPTDERRFRANPKAWNFFQSQAPSYQKAACWWVISAKKDETKLKRLATLVKDSENGRRIKPLTSPAQRKTAGT